jgi:ABC-type uncharacterized transport system substrate-binding protein
LVADAQLGMGRERITELVTQCRLPAIYPARQLCEAGGLMSYGVIIAKVIAAAASYVDLILRGANPAELPVQAPTEFEFVVNQKNGTAARPATAACIARQRRRSDRIESAYGPEPTFLRVGGMSVPGRKPDMTPTNGDFRS